MPYLAASTSCWKANGGCLKYFVVHTPMYFHVSLHNYTERFKVNMVGHSQPKGDLGRKTSSPKDEVGQTPDENNQRHPKEVPLLHTILASMPDRQRSLLADKNKEPRPKVADTVESHAAVDNQKSGIRRQTREGKTIGDNLGIWNEYELA
jgi:hypothetical protein